jgi:hypothetical protein
MLTLGIPASASAHATATSAGPSWRSHTIVVKPNGYNDTTDIQNAFNTCTSHNWMCTIQLVKGTYYTAQVIAFGFQGSFVGAGQGRTIIQALPNLPAPAAAYNTPSAPFWAGAPTTVTGSNPWPCLFTFENGTFSVSGMTINDSYSDAIASPGWYDYGVTTPNTSLYTGIEITGLQAYVAIDHVTVLGTSGDAAGTNMWDAIGYEGMILLPGWTNAQAQRILLTGTFSVTNSVFNSVESGPWIDSVASATVTVCYNTITNSPSPLGFFDVSNSQLLFCGNDVSGVQVYTAFTALQSDFIPGLLPSTAYVTDNDFHVSDGANAVWLEDFGQVNFGTAPTLTAVVSGNVFQTDTSCDCYNGSLPGDYSVLLSISLASFDVSKNTILGGGAAGIYVVGGPGVVSGNTIRGSYVGVNLNATDGVHVTGNLIKNSAWWGIALTNGSSDNVVAHNFVTGSGEYDLYWDETGTGNVWFGNMCQTSSPSGLC